MEQTNFKSKFSDINSKICFLTCEIWTLPSSAPSHTPLEFSSVFFFLSRIIRIYMEKFLLHSQYLQEIEKQKKAETISKLQNYVCVILYIEWNVREHKYSSAWFIREGIFWIHIRKAHDKCGFNSFGRSLLSMATIWVHYYSDFCMQLKKEDRKSPRDSLINYRTFVTNFHERMEAKKRWFNISMCNMPFVWEIDMKRKFCINCERMREKKLNLFSY